MRNLFRFIKIYHFVLLFILMESFSLFLYISNHKFQQSKFLSFTQEYTGAIFSYYSDLNQDQIVNIQDIIILIAIILGN